MSTREPWRYEKLTWPEINQAVQATKVVVVPIGSIEQHGPHLPLDVDVVCPVGVAHHAARLIPDQVLIMPPIIHGYTAHVMDFPGTINIHYEHFIRMVMDVGKSLAYHGFKKIILLNGHGSNWPNLDLASRRINLETDAECSAVCWWSLITIDKEFYEVVEGEQVSRRLLSCRRAGNLRVPVSRRRKRPERQDCRWRNRIQQGQLRLLLDRSSCVRTGSRHFLDGQLFGQRRTGPRHTGDQGKRPAGSHGIGPAVGALDRRVRVDTEAAPRRPPRSQTDDNDALEPAGTADQEW